MTDILNLKVSFQEAAYAPISEELTIGEVLIGIQEKRLDEFVTSLRKMLNNGYIDSYKLLKIDLPCVTFSGTFNVERRRENIKTYNKIIVLDIDKLTAEQLISTKQILNKDPFVLSFWESPSQRGLKGIVCLDNIEEIIDLDKFHRVAFKKLFDYFQINYKIELDESGSDTTRLCLLSSDAHIVIKDDFQKFPVNQHDIERLSASVRPSSRSKKREVGREGKEEALLKTGQQNPPKQKAIMRSIIKYLIENDLSITNSYDEWYRVAYAIADTFTYDIGIEYFLKLSQQDKEKYNETECRNRLIYCYQTNTSEIKFSTIVFYAKEIGYILKKGEK